MIGLTIPVVGLLVGISQRNIRLELIYLGAGAALFTLGWLLLRRYKR